MFFGHQDLSTNSDDRRARLILLLVYLLGSLGAKHYATLASSMDLSMNKVCFIADWSLLPPTTMALMISVGGAVSPENLYRYRSAGAGDRGLLVADFKTVPYH